METQWLGGAAGDSGDESEPPPPPPSNTVLASLYVQDGKSGAFTSEVHPLYAGYNVVGRDSSTVQAEPSAEAPRSQPTNDARLQAWRADLPTDVVHGVFLANAAVSNTHAYINIEVIPEGKWYTVSDQESLNKTFLQRSDTAKMPLRPKVSTALEDGNILYFGELMCVFSEGAPPEVEGDEPAAVTDTLATDAPATDALATDAAAAAAVLVTEPAPSPPPHPVDAHAEEAGADSGAVSQSTLPYAAAADANEAGAGDTAEAEATPATPAMEAVAEEPATPATEAVADFATQRVVHPPDVRTPETQAVRGRVDSLSTSDPGLPYTAGMNADTVMDDDSHVRGDEVPAEATAAAAAVTSEVAVVVPTQEALQNIPEEAAEEAAEAIPDAAEEAAEGAAEKATAAGESDPVKLTVAVDDDDADTEAGSQELLEAEAAMAAEQQEPAAEEPVPAAEEIEPAAEEAAAAEPAVEEVAAAVRAASPGNSSATTALTEDLEEADAQTGAAEAAAGDDATSGARGSANADEDGGVGVSSTRGQRSQDKDKSAPTTTLDQSRAARASLGGNSETQRYPETMVNEMPLFQNFLDNMGDRGAADSPGVADSPVVAPTTATPAAATPAATPAAATVDGSGAVEACEQNDSAPTSVTSWEGSTDRRNSTGGGWRKRDSAVGGQAARMPKPPAEVVATEAPVAKPPPLAHDQVYQGTFDFNETDHPVPNMLTRPARRRSNAVDARAEVAAANTPPPAAEDDAGGAQQAETTTATATATEAAAVASAAMGGSVPPSDTQVAAAWTSVRGDYSAGVTPPPAAESAGSEPAAVPAAAAAAADVALDGAGDDAVTEAGSDAVDAMEEAAAAEVDGADAGGDGGVVEEPVERAVTEAAAECAAEDVADPAPEAANAQPVLSALNRQLIASMDTEAPGEESQALSNWQSPPWATKPTPANAAQRLPSSSPSPSPELRRMEAETAPFVSTDKAPKGRGGRRDGGSKAATTPIVAVEAAAPTSAQGRPTRGRAGKAATEGAAKAADVETPAAAQPKKRGRASKVAEEEPAVAADSEETVDADAEPPAAAQPSKRGRASKAATKGAAAADVKTPASAQRAKRGRPAKTAQEDAGAEAGPSAKRTRATATVTATTSSAAEPEPAEIKGRKGKRARGESDEQAEAAAAAAASAAPSKRARGKAAAAATTTMTAAAAAAPAAPKTKAKGKRAAAVPPAEAPPTTTSSDADPSLALAHVSQPAAAAGRRAAAEHPAPRVLFSANVKLTEKLKNMVLNLGGTMATEGTHDFTHFVCPEFHRTENLLVALAAGRPVVSPQWVRASAAEHTWLNTREHLIQDSKNKFGFTMEASLAAAKRAPLLRGVTVAFTPTVAKGKVGEMLARVVPHAGGVVLPKLPTAAQVKALGKLMLIAHDSKDAAACCSTLAAAAVDTCAAYDAEVLLTGLLHQQLDLAQYRLELDSAKTKAKAPSTARRGK